MCKISVIITTPKNCSKAQSNVREKDNTGVANTWSLLCYHPFHYLFLGLPGLGCLQQQPVPFVGPPASSKPRIFKVSWDNQPPNVCRSPGSHTHSGISCLEVWSGWVWKLSFCHLRWLQASGLPMGVSGPGLQEAPGRGNVVIWSRASPQSGD